MTFKQIQSQLIQSSDYGLIKQREKQELLFYLAGMKKAMELCKDSPTVERCIERIEWEIRQEGGE